MNLDVNGDFFREYFQEDYTSVACKRYCCLIKNHIAGCGIDCEIARVKQNRAAHRVFIIPRGFAWEIHAIRVELKNRGIPPGEIYALPVHVHRNTCTSEIIHVVYDFWTVVEPCEL